MLIYSKKLAQWYRRKYKRTEIKKSESSSANPFTTVLATGIEKPPRKRTPLHHYFKWFYNSRIKEEYNRRFAVAKKLFDEASEDNKLNGSAKKPMVVQIRTEVGREFWFLEMEEFQEQMVEEVEDIHTKEMEDWEAMKQVPKTAQQFHQ